MYEPKLRLTITLPGSVMMSEQECSENPKENYKSFSIEWTKTKKFKGKTVNIKERVYVNNVRKCVPCKQTLSISEESYQMMIDECPSWEKPFVWKKYNIHQKLKSHFNILTQQFGGIGFHYEFIEN